MSKGYVNRILPFSSVDGPGNRTAIFLQGCNFNCLYCHNPETISRCSHCGNCITRCPYGALTLDDRKVTWNQEACEGCDECLRACCIDSSPKVKEMTVEEVVTVIKKTKAFVSGITVSGGECTLQMTFLKDLFKAVKKLDLSIFIDTNGSLPLWEDQEFFNLFDMAMVDLKAFDREEHLSLTGVDNDTVLENITYLARHKKLYEVRTVVVEGLLNNFRTIDETSRLIASLDPNIGYKLIKYRPLGVREGLVPGNTPSVETIEKLTQLAAKNGCRNLIEI